MKFKNLVELKSLSGFGNDGASVITVHKLPQN